MTLPYETIFSRTRGRISDPKDAQAGSQRRAHHLAAAPVRRQQQGRGMAAAV